MPRTASRSRRAWCLGAIKTIRYVCPMAASDRGATRGGTSRVIVAQPFPRGIGRPWGRQADGPGTRRCGPGHSEIWHAPNGRRRFGCPRVQVKQFSQQHLCQTVPGDELFARVTPSSVSRTAPSETSTSPDARIAGRCSDTSHPHSQSVGSSVCFSLQAAAFALPRSAGMMRWSSSATQSCSSRWSMRSCVRSSVCAPGLPAPAAALPQWTSFSARFRSLDSMTLPSPRGASASGIARICARAPLRLQCNRKNGICNHS